MYRNEGIKYGRFSRIRRILNGVSQELKEHSFHTTGRRALLERVLEGKQITCPLSIPVTDAAIWTQMEQGKCFHFAHSSFPKSWISGAGLLEGESPTSKGWLFALDTDCQPDVPEAAAGWSKECWSKEKVRTF